MKTLYLLITLTQNAAGDVNAAFVNTETLQQCQQKLIMVESVFKNSNIPILESRCIKSDMQFSKFGHAANSRDIRHFYLTYFDAVTTRIVTMPDWRACMSQKKNNTEQSRVYCSSSVQSVQ